MNGPRWTLAIAILAAGACGRRDRPAAADSTAASAAAADSTAAPAGYSARVEGFQGPESAKYDADLDVWYVQQHQRLARG